MARIGDDLPDDKRGGGYGQPPEQHRIKAGEVRNPWGRKGKPGTKRDFLDEPFEMRVDGKSVSITRDEALDQALFHAAMKGNVSAVTKLENRKRERARAANDDEARSALSSDDAAALDRYVLRRAREPHTYADRSPDHSMEGQSLGPPRASARR